MIDERIQPQPARRDDHRRRRDRMLVSLLFERVWLRVSEPRDAAMRTRRGAAFLASVVQPHDLLKLSMDAYRDFLRRFRRESTTSTSRRETG